LKPVDRDARLRIDEAIVSFPSNKPGVGFYALITHALEQGVGRIAQDKPQEFGQQLGGSLFRLGKTIKKAEFRRI
jgi:hypothetical protein